MVGRVVRPDANDNMSAVAHDVRACCGRPHNNGSNSTETRNGIWEVEGVDVNACSTSEIPDKLRAGKAVQFCCEYAALPSYVRTQGGSFGHSVCLYGWTDANGGCVGFYDPLYNQDSNGLWARWSDIKGAGWGGDAHNYSVKGAPQSEPPPEEPKPCPPCPPCPPEGYTLIEVNAIVASELLHQQDALVAGWMQWLSAGPQKPQDAWGNGSWSDAVSRAAVELIADPCNPVPSAFASWARNPNPFPIAQAAKANEITGVWGETDWRECQWT